MKHASSTSSRMTKAPGMIPASAIVLSALDDFEAVVASPELLMVIGVSVTWLEPLVVVVVAMTALEPLAVVGVSVDSLNPLVAIGSGANKPVVLVVVGAFVLEPEVAAHFMVLEGVLGNEG
ncbi:hypothetical protein BBJ28_00015946 [Nothophytophthora sp. Chile5]|nr:hypothetical protein BBJ28_00015946 [Nothophytophthora sp. Chile5]